MASKKPDASELESEPSTTNPEPEITAGNGAAADTDAMRPWAPAVASPIEDFDFRSLRLPQDFDAQVGSRPVLTTIDVRRPKGNEWVQTHPSPDFQRLLGLVEVPAGTYVIHQDLAPLLGGLVKPRLLVAAITSHGVPILWPLRQQGPDGRTDSYMTSENKAATRARNSWMRLVSNQHARAFDVFEATAKMPEPQWPELDFDAWLKLAFGVRAVRSPDHPLVRFLLTGAE
jgi:hypothetical protein